jgi:hypothetical protein
MIGTNRDLASMQALLDHEIRLLNRMLGTAPEQNMIEARLSLLRRQRIAVCAAVVNRRIEASNKVVVFSDWVSGNGALHGPDVEHKSGNSGAREKRLTIKPVSEAKRTRANRAD